MSRMRSSPSVTRRDAADHPHRRGLAGAVGTEEAERLTPAHLDVDAVDGGEVAEALGQPPRAQQDVVGHRHDARRPGGRHQPHSAARGPLASPAPGDIHARAAAPRARPCLRTVRARPPGAAMPAVQRLDRRAAAERRHDVAASQRVGIGGTELVLDEGPEAGDAHRQIVCRRPLRSRPLRCRAARPGRHTGRHAPDHCRRGADLARPSPRARRPPVRVGLVQHAWDEDATGCAPRCASGIAHRGRRRRPHRLPARADALRATRPTRSPAGGRTPRPSRSRTARP